MVSNIIGTGKVLESKVLHSQKNPDWVGYSLRCASNLSASPVWVLCNEEIPVGEKVNFVVQINSYNSLRGVTCVRIYEDF